MKYLKYILALMILFPSVALADPEGQIIIREYYRGYTVQPYIVDYRTRQVDRKESCRETVKSIMDAYYIHDVYDLRNLKFLETKYICLNSYGGLVDSGYYYIVPKNNITDSYCIIEWLTSLNMYHNVDSDCLNNSTFVSRRFDKLLRYSGEE